MSKTSRTLITALLLLVASTATGRATRVGINPGGWLDVDGTPMLILGGELGNSAGSCRADIEANLTLLAENGINTVLLPVTWELLEPEEGKFDYSQINSVIDTAKVTGLKVVVLWFGAWKNSMSCYAPEWVKRDQKRFPRARTEYGRPLEILSAFSADVLDADLKAFRQLLNYIKEYDKDSTVVMIQVENEIGMLENARDHSPQARQAFNEGVPAELTAFLSANKATLHPLLLEKWSSHGYKEKGSWTEVFGDDLFTEEYFTAWNYGRYVENLAREGKKILPVVYYLNAALNSRDRKPGEYPSGGPLAHLKDIWHASAPSIDFLSPDIYDTGFEGWTASYALPDNVLFIPEVRRELANGPQALYVVGHHNALGFSPFAIENGDTDYFNNLRGTYTLLKELTPVIARKQLLKEGVLLSAEKPEETLSDGEVRITLSHFFTLPWDPRAADRANWKEAGAILLKLADEEYLLAGTGIVARFENQSEGGIVANLGEDGFAAQGNGDTTGARSGSSTARIGLAKVEEVAVSPDGTLSTIRTLNGDETHQGRHVRIGVDDYKILHIKTYKYE